LVACALLAGAGLPAAAAATTQAPRARVSAPGIHQIGASSNWSGYAAGAASKITYASGNWVVPSVGAVKGFSSSWVGVDGATNNHLIQTGTEQDFDGHNFIYRAWWEILPAPETIIPGLVIKPGDNMFGSVQDTSGNNWVITLKDLTSGKSFSINKHYTGPGQSMEWIQEAPTGPGGILPLAHYTTTEFSNLLAALSFGSPFNPHIVYSSMAIEMIQHGKVVSSPSKPNSAGNAFRVAYGPKAPPHP
jgi:hypothetical protein